MEASLILLMGKLQNTIVPSSIPKVKRYIQYNEIWRFFQIYSRINPKWSAVILALQVRGDRFLHELGISELNNFLILRIIAFRQILEVTMVITLLCFPCLLVPSIP